MRILILLAASLSGCTLLPNTWGGATSGVPVNPVVANVIMTTVALQAGVQQCVELPVPQDVAEACKPVPTTTSDQAAGNALAACLSASSSMNLYTFLRKYQAVICPIGPPAPAPVPAPPPVALPGPKPN